MQEPPRPINDRPEGWAHSTNQRSLPNAEMPGWVDGKAGVGHSYFTFSVSNDKMTLIILQVGSY